MQVQLRQGYNKAQAAREERNAPQVKTRFGGVPLVHMSRDAETEGTGILKARQQKWLSGFPYESSTEDPVLYKYVSPLQPPHLL